MRCEDRGVQLGRSGGCTTIVQAHTDVLLFDQQSPPVFQLGVRIWEILGGLYLGDVGGFVFWDVLRKPRLQASTSVHWGVKKGCMERCMEWCTEGCMEGCM